MPRSIPTLTLAALSLAVLTTTACGQYKSADYDYQVTTIAEGLENAWSMAFLPGGEMLVTERPGRLRVIKDGQLQDTAVAGLPDVHARGQGGLLDVVAHPDFATNRMLYLSYSKPQGGTASTTALIRGRYENGALTNVEEIFEAVSEGRGHYGSRIAFDGDGYLFFSVGDRQASPSGDLEAHPAQDRSNHHGTINRIHEDGRIPADNPFVGEAGMQPSIWSYGHRNPQGLAFHPETGDLWANEHGPQGGDELNLIEPGKNYGWPVIGYGVNYRSGTAIHEGTHRDGMEQPKHIWVPSIATSGLLIYTGNVFPEWKGSALVGGMAGAQIARVELDGQSADSEETLVKGIGRVRDIRQGPDGHIYIAIDAAGGKSILRMDPVTGTN
jgi:glucose/arabinose dehydrogenase